MAVNEIHARFDDDINHEQVKPEEEHRDNDNRCRSNKLVSRRPGDVIQFLPNIANELDAALDALSDSLKEFFHRSAIVRGTAPQRSGRPGGTRTPNMRFWRPPLYQFELLACSSQKAECRRRKAEVGSLCLLPSAFWSPATSSLYAKCAPGTACRTS